MSLSILGTVIKHLLLLAVLPSTIQAQITDSPSPDNFIRRAYSAGKIALRKVRRVQL